MSEHTPTPWRASRKSVYVSDINHNCLAQMLRGGNENQANAAFIVKAVNAHDALVKALTDTLCELTACANQLAARGLKGREGDSVSRAQIAARAVLANAKASEASDDR